MAIEKDGRISIWIGKTPKNISDYYNYFDQEKHGENCGLCQDLKITWYDEDKFSPFYSETELTASEIFNEIPFIECFEEEINKDCKTLKIDQANACFCLLDFDAELTPGKIFNDIAFIGAYNYDTQALNELIN